MHNSVEIGKYCKIMSFGSLGIENNNTYCNKKVKLNISWISLQINFFEKLIEEKSLL